MRKLDDGTKRMQDAISYVLQVAKQEKFAVVGFCVREDPDVSILAMQTGGGDFVKQMQTATEFVKNHTQLVPVSVPQVN